MTLEMNETEFRRQTKEYLKNYQHGLWWAEVQHIAGNYTTTKGLPDFSGLYEGVYVGIECKVGKGKLRPEQIEFKGRVESCGGYYLTVYPNDFMDVIRACVQEILRGKK